MWLWSPKRRHDINHTKSLELLKGLSKTGKANGVRHKREELTNVDIAITITLSMCDLIVISLIEKLFLAQKNIS